MQFLIVPGLGGSGPTHWQSLWERSYPGTMRVDQGDWERPDRDGWIDQLHQAIRAPCRPGSDAPDRGGDAGGARGCRFRG
jgi:predicted alpha/beta hydrolase family esterase